MTALIISVTALFLFATIIAALPYINAAWRRIVVRDQELQLWRVMGRRCIVPDASPAGQAQLARAVRRCVMCPSIEQCDRWLAANAQDGLEEFCPNVTLVDALDSRRS